MMVWALQAAAPHVPVHKHVCNLVCWRVRVQLDFNSEVIPVHDTRTVCATDMKHGPCASLRDGGSGHNPAAQS